MDVFKVQSLKTPQILFSLMLQFSILPHWRLAQGWSYHHSNTKMTWNEAEVWCKAHYTNMVAIQNHQEIKYLDTILPKVSGYYWIGIRKTNGTWTWVGTGKPLMAHAENWAKGEPNNVGKEQDCVEIYIKRDKDAGKWNDEACFKKKTALCYTASCKVDSCGQHGECVETINSHKCECAEGFYGELCDQVIQCQAESIFAPQHGSVHCSEPYGPFTYSSQCEYSCVEGYQIAGSRTTRCNSSRTWSNQPPTCEVVQCPKLTAPAQGAMCCDDPLGPFSYLSSCGFTCQDGHTLVGSATRQLLCTTAGHWNDSVPTCEPVQCPALEEPVNGTTVCSGDGVSFRTVCSFSCNEGFRLQGAPEITCTKSAQWSEQTPYCEAVQCPALEEPVNGTTVCSGDSVSFRTACSFSCNEGFRLQGATEITCTKSAQWSEQTPYCEAIRCRLPGEQTHLSSECSRSPDDLTVNSTCHFSCDAGFDLQGAVRTKCTETGDWSTAVPHCTAVQCPALEEPVNGTTVCSGDGVSFRTVCSFSCNEGFRLQGAPEITCTKSAQWSEQTPYCEAIRCRLPGEQTHLSSECSRSPDDLTVNSTCHFSCDAGFDLQGAVRTKCTETGDWSTAVPHCTAVTCPHLQDPFNGLINCSSEKAIFGTICSFACVDGYQLHGYEMVTCNLSGNWSGEAAVCQEVPAAVLGTSALTGLTLGAGGAALSSLSLVFWVMKRLRRKANKFSLSNSDITMPTQTYKSSTDSLI